MSKDPDFPLTEKASTDWLLGKLNHSECHKKVHARKILGIIEHPADEFMLLFDDKNGERFSVGVDKSFMLKHEPKIGGYYVRYKDGYPSWSPAEAFEDGYTRIKEDVDDEV